MNADLFVFLNAFQNNRKTFDRQERVCLPTINASVVGESNGSLRRLQGRHSRQGRNPVQKHWIPGQARNDKNTQEISESLCLLALTSSYDHLKGNACTNLLNGEA